MAGATQWYVDSETRSLQHTLATIYTFHAFAAKR